jgi:hypothetical protein
VLGGQAHHHAVAGGEHGGAAHVVRQHRHFAHGFTGADVAQRPGDAVGGVALRAQAAGNQEVGRIAGIALLEEDFPAFQLAPFADADNAFQRRRVQPPEVADQDTAEAAHLALAVIGQGRGGIHEVLSFSEGLGFSLVGEGGVASRPPSLRWINPFQPP